MKIEGDPLNTQHAQHRPVKATDRREPSPVEEFINKRTCLEPRSERRRREEEEEEEEDVKIIA